jgi:hypothetical protein
MVLRYGKHFTKEEVASGAPIQSLPSLVNNSNPAPAMRLASPLMLFSYLVSKLRQVATEPLAIDGIATSLCQDAYDQLSSDEKPSVQRTILSIVGRLTITFTVDITRNKYCILQLPRLLQTDSIEWEVQQIRKASARPLCDVSRGLGAILPPYGMHTWTFQIAVPSWLYGDKTGSKRAYGFLITCNVFVYFGISRMSP